MSDLKVLLGSSSKFRKKLCAQALPPGFVMTQRTISPDIDEKSIRDDDPHKMVVAISEAKTSKVLQILSTEQEVSLAESPDFIVCGDQVILFGDQVREKPTTEAQAKEHLQSYGRESVPAVCVCGITVTNLRTKQSKSGVETATLHWKSIPDDVAVALIAKGDVMYCAGSFVVEDELLQPYIDKIEGDIECVQGLPLTLTKNLLTAVNTESS